MNTDTAEKTIGEMLDEAKKEFAARITRMLPPSKASASHGIAVYTAAVATNFQFILAVANMRSSSGEATLATDDNLECELKDDHIGMLLDFAEKCKALPDKKHYAETKDQMAAIRDLLRNPNTVGLKALAIVTLLENLSPIFMPYLAAMAKALELKDSDMTYINTHGEADSRHAEELMEALITEAEQNYDNSTQAIKEAFEATINLINRIF